MIIRDANKEDVPVILELIQGLAEFENEPDAVSNTVQGLSESLFEKNICEAIVAEIGGKVVGFALFYTSYSTWKGPCLYLEDLYILPEYRGEGAGSKLFDKVVQIAKDRKVPRMDWQVLDWNTPAINFYKHKGATLDDEWLNGRLFFPENEKS